MTQSNQRGRESREREQGRSPALAGGSVGRCPALRGDGSPGRHLSHSVFHRGLLRRVRHVPGLDVKILDKDNEEIDIKQTYDEDENMPMASDYYDESDVAVDSEIEDNYTMENPDEDSDSYDDADFDGSEDEDDDGFDF